MKIFAGVAILSIGFISLASAADLPDRRLPPPYFAPVSVFSWTGFYMGVNAGYVFDNATHVSLTGLTPANINSPTTYSRGDQPTFSDNGFTGGGQVGYNYQFGRSGGPVIGFETDVSYTAVHQAIDSPTPEGAGRLFSSRLDLLGTARGRVGYAFDRLLVYGTGGLAYGETDNSADLLNRPNIVTRFSGSRNELRTGYAIGGGVEYAIPTDAFLNAFKAGAVTIKAEYLHYDLGAANVVASAVPGTGAIGAYNARLAINGNLARVGLNYKY